MRKLYVLIFFLSVPLLLLAQPTKLAQQYYQNGEYEKAASLYQKLYEENENNDYYFNKYIDCLLALDQFEETEKILRKQIKNILRVPNSTLLMATCMNGSIVMKMLKHNTKRR